MDYALRPDDDLEGNGKSHLKLLELFKGTGSVGKVAKRMGMTVMSVDILDKYKPDITADILEWDYKKFHRDTHFVPDLIWASPPCNTFSILAYPLKERDIKTAKPLSERARQGTAILYRTLEIIHFFMKLNPNLLYCMENPRGMMRLDEKVQKLPHRDTTLYCLYNDVRKKPTDFFNNVKLDLKDPDYSACKGKQTVAVVELPLNKRYAIPPKLVRTILTKMADKYRS
jgi:site-specific DNA-cytosine methylase